MTLLTAADQLSTALGTSRRKLPRVLAWSKTSLEISTRLWFWRNLTSRLERTLLIVQVNLQHTMMNICREQCWRYPKSIGSSASSFWRISSSLFWRRAPSRLHWWRSITTTGKGGSTMPSSRWFSELSSASRHSYASQSSQMASATLCSNWGSPTNTLTSTPIRATTN